LQAALDEPILSAVTLVKSFLAAETNRRLPSALVIFCVACTGGALCLIAAALSIRWLYRIGFGIGFLGALVFVLYVWWRLYIGTLGSEPETPQDEQSPH
jgi:hypothetical protein